MVVSRRLPVSHYSKAFIKRRGTDETEQAWAVIFNEIRQSAASVQSVPEDTTAQ